MKNNTVKFIGVLLLSFFLTGCSKDVDYDFLRRANKHWTHYGEGRVDNPFAYEDEEDWEDYYNYYYGDEDEDDDDDDDGYVPGGSYDADKAPFKYDKYLAALGDTEVAIAANPNYCKDENLVIPGTYVSGGVTYTVVMDTSNGFAYLPCKTMTLPDGFKKLTHIEQCSKLTKITIPASLVSIAEYAFTGCTKLSTIEYKGTTEQWQAISKGTSWNYLTPSNMVVSCSNGTLNNQGWES